MNKYKKLLLLTSLIAGSAVSRADGIIAFVDGEAITSYEAMKYNRYVEIQLARQYKGDELAARITSARQHALKAYINQKVLVNEFHRKGYKIPTYLIEEKINELVQSQAGGDRRLFQKKLIDKGQSMEEVRQVVKEKIAGRMLVDQFVYSKIVITEEDVGRYIEENKALFLSEAEFKVQVLFLKKSDHKTAAFDALVKLVESRIKEKVDFDILINKYCEGRFAASNGHLGWLKDSEIRDDCRESVFATKKGAVSQKTKLPEGVAFFKILDLKKPKAFEPNFQERVRIVEVLKKDREVTALENYLQELRKQCVIVEKFKVNYAE